MLVEQSGLLVVSLKVSLSLMKALQVLHMGISVTMVVAVPSNRFTSVTESFYRSSMISL